MKKNSLLFILILLVMFVSKSQAQQIKVLNLMQPYAFTYSATNQDVIVQFKNTGAVYVTSVDFAMTFNGFGLITNTWTGFLNPGYSTFFNIGLMGINGGTNTLQVTVGAVNGIAFTDTADYLIQTISTALAIPFIDDMEGTANFGSSGNNWTTGNNPDSWQLAVPNYGVITPSPTPTAWVMGLDSGYGNDISSYLYSPIFNFAASGINSVWFHFTANANLSANDNLTVEYTTDFLTWTQLPSAVTVTGNTGGWAGFGTGLAFLASETQVQLRFVFNSDGSGTSDGIAIDDIEVIQCVISLINLNQLTSISCHGACDGVLEAAPQVGFPPFTYLWNSGETTQSISNVCAGNYTVTVTDVNGCTGSTGQTVNEPSPLVFSLGPDVSICMGDSVVLCPNPTGGTAPYTFLWNTGEITSCITSFISGIYYVPVFDANGCFYPGDTVTVTVNPLPVVMLGPDVFICDGTFIQLNAGFGGATYQWSTGQNTQTIMVNTGGPYTVTVTNMFGCTGSDDIVITQSTPLVVTPHDFYNCLSGIDSVFIDVTGGGSPPYTYNWSGGTTNNVNFVNNIAPGVYTVVVTDVNGCTGSATFTIYGALHLLINKTDPECFGYTGTIAADFNGIPPITYQWSNGVTVPQLVNAPGGTYTVTVTDVTGCSLSVTDSLVEPEQIVLTLDSVIASGCGASDGAFYYSYTPPGFSIPNINGTPFAVPINLAAGIYDIYIHQNVCASNTLQVVVPDSCEDVWPGDANYDLQADNKDLLQIGLAYGNTGPVRPGASNTWIAQTCPDWSNWFNIGVNQKHADCDGNGIIDAADTIPIMLNYGLTHLLKQVIIPQVNTLAPDLYLVITQDTTGLTDSVFVNVMCGTAADPVDSIYGLAFRLYYDSALVDTSSIFFNINNSFIGTVGTNAISINKNFGVGYADFAITRTDHNNTSGFGPVCVMSIVTTDNVAGKMLTPVNTVLRFSLGDVYALTVNENPVVLDAFGDSIFIDSTMTGINNLSWEREVKVYPNPANNYFTITSSLTNISKISMLNQFGEVIYKNEKPRLPQRINVSNITNGIYFLRIESKDGVMYRKIEIIR
ncbi:MAG: T9SS type A sorting domain-containing protein [Bacteroidia bacterium]